MLATIRRVEDSIKISARKRKNKEENREGTGNPDSGGAEDIRPSVHIVDCVTTSLSDQVAMSLHNDHYHFSPTPGPALSTMVFLPPVLTS